MINAKQFNERQSLRRLAEVLARKRLEAEPVGNEALLEKPLFDAFRPLVRQAPQFAPVDARNTASGKIDAFVRGAANAITFGAMDEAAAALDAVTHPILGRGSEGENFSARYNENLAKQRAIDAADEEKRYWYQKTGEGAAAALIMSRLGLATPRVVSNIAARRAATTVPMRAEDYRKLLVASGADAALFGAFNDFGSGEGGIQNRLDAVHKNMYQNGIFGAVAPVAISAITKAAKPIITPAIKQIKLHAADQIKRNAENMVSATMKTADKNKLREWVWIRDALDQKVPPQPAPRLTRREKNLRLSGEFEDLSTWGNRLQGVISPLLPNTDR